MEIAVSGGTVFFTGFPWVCDEPSGDSNRLMTTDGTPGGTHDVMLPNISRQLTDMGGTLYFSARGGNNHPRMWKSDGTPSGTGKLVPAFPDRRERPSRASRTHSGGPTPAPGCGRATARQAARTWSTRFRRSCRPFRSLGGSVVYFSATDGVERLTSGDPMGRAPGRGRSPTSIRGQLRRRSGADPATILG